MSDEQVRRMERAIEQEALQLAVDEVLAVKSRYHPADVSKPRGDRPLLYTFEFEGKTVEAAFLSAAPDGDENGYTILLLAHKSVICNGGCYITDSRNRRLGGSVNTKIGDVENHITISTIAVP